jgi:hypothetical protein
MHIMLALRPASPSMRLAMDTKDPKPSKLQTVLISRGCILFTGEVIWLVHYVYSSGMSGSPSRAFSNYKDAIEEVSRLRLEDTY